MRHLIPLTLPLSGAALLLMACSDSTRPPEPAPRTAARDATAAATVPGAQFAVTKRDLGTLGGRASRAIGINDNGVVVGWSLNGAGLRTAFKWTSATGMRALPRLAAGRPCQANHVTENGKVAGFCLNSSGKQRAVLWSASGVIRDLGTLPGGTWSQATDVNDAGTVVGFSDVAVRGVRATRAFKWTAAGGMRDLGNLDHDPGCSSYAERINRTGQIAGTNGACQNNEEAVRWSPTGAVQALGVPGNAGYSYGFGINDAGSVVGHGQDFAALWTPGSGWRLLGALPGGYFGVAFAVNNSDQVVGYAERAVGGGRSVYHAFVWTSANGMQDLGTLSGGNTSHANDINNHQQVVGWSEKTGGVTHATLWTLQ